MQKAVEGSNRVSNWKNRDINTFNSYRARFRVRMEVGVESKHPKDYFSQMVIIDVVYCI